MFNPSNGPKNGLGVLLDRKIEEKHLLKHNLYVRWQKGDLSHHELQGYAREYYQFEKEFPRFVSAIHSHTEDADMRRALLEHLIEEEQGEENHPELWLRFAEGLGVPREGVKEHFHSDETEHLLRVFRKHCFSGTAADGLACLYAYERQQPKVVEKKIEGLKQFYGLTSDRAVAFFKIHEKLDVWHADNALKQLEALCIDESSQKRAQEVTEETVSALNDFLDGVERRYAA